LHNRLQSVNGLLGDHNKHIRLATLAWWWRWPDVVFTIGSSSNIFIFIFIFSFIFIFFLIRKHNITISQ